MSVPSTLNQQDLLLRRSDQLREQEWEMAQKLLALASTLIRRLRLKTDCASPSHIHALLDLASRLGRLSCALPADHLDRSLARSSLPSEIEEALTRVYGSASNQAARNLPSNLPAFNSQPPVAPELGAGGPTPCSR